MWQSFCHTAAMLKTSPGSLFAIMLLGFQDQHVQNANMQMAQTDLRLAELNKEIHG